MRLYHNWFGLLNRGKMLTPVGASDSHEVSRFIVGQARTYIRSTSTRPGKIDVDEAVAAQAADLLREHGVRLDDRTVRQAAHNAGPHVERAFEQYRQAWRDSQVARKHGR
jgi:hypothetical protein